MIKKRKRKNKKRKRRKEIEDDPKVVEEIATIQPSEKKRKVNHLTATASTKKKKKDDTLTSEGNKETDPSKPPEATAFRKDYTKMFNKNVRLTSEVDFLDVGICKDYQRTGTCGYGLNCIYAHIRENYKSSFEISKEYEEQQRREKLGLDDSDSDSDSEDEDAVPKICPICDEEFKSPIVTKCHHFFCESCIMKHYNCGKNPHCPICGSPTDGIFNSADDILESALKKEEKKEEDGKDEKKDRGFRMGWNY